MLHEEILEDYKKLIYAAMKQAIEAKRKAIISKWLLIYRGIIDNPEKAGDLALIVALVVEAMNRRSFHLTALSYSS